MTQHKNLTDLSAQGFTEVISIDVAMNTKEYVCVNHDAHMNHS